MCMVDKLCGNGGKKRLVELAFLEDVVVLLVDLGFTHVASAVVGAAVPAVGVGNRRAFCGDSARIRLSPSSP
jgi:hypothetical protein